MIDIWKILVAVLSVFGGKREPVDEYPYVIPDEIPSGEPYVPQSSREIEEAAHALYGHGDDIIWPDRHGKSYAGIKGDEYRWPDKTIPLAVTRDVSNDRSLLQTFDKARRYIESKTCLKMVPKKKEDKNYVVLKKDGSKCYSYVGCQRTGSQSLSLGQGCNNFGTIVHELCHALGMFHEHNRSDRDDYITVYKDNVKPAEWHNFVKKEPEEEETYNTSYRYESIMHYGNTAFSKNPKGNLKTMEAKDGTELTNPYMKKEMTEEDIKILNKMYNC